MQSYSHASSFKNNKLKFNVWSPKTTTCLPSREICDLSKSSIIPNGVHGEKFNTLSSSMGNLEGDTPFILPNATEPFENKIRRFYVILPIFKDVIPSMSLEESTASMILAL